jgi:tRNA-uridine 2-sulfurtransferase
LVVIALDAPRRRVIVGPRTNGTTRVQLREVNWLIPEPREPLRCTVKLRARESPQPATVIASREATKQFRSILNADAPALVTLDSPALLAPG